MITSKEAYNLVMADKIRPEVILIELEKAIGYTLAEDVYADRDFPPFERVAMDGIAIKYAEYEGGNKDFEIKGICRAGHPIKSLVGKNNCLEVMTGSISPMYADTVVRYEDIDISMGRAYINMVSKPYGNIHHQGSDIKAGTKILSKGKKIHALDVNILATVGKFMVQVIRPLNVAIISTGDELVDVHIKPESYQIRRSNVHMMKSAVMDMGGQATTFHLPDREEEIEKELSRILNNFEVILISGGVSKGKFDFLPKVLTNLNCEKIFHRVAQRPGKPFWFGSKGNIRIFAFPGNPISTLMCFYKYFKPWYLSKIGQSTIKLYVKLEHEVRFEPKLQFFPMVKLTSTIDGLTAKLTKSNGSGDMISPTYSDGFLELPMHKSIFKRDELYPFISITRLS